MKTFYLSGKEFSRLITLTELLTQNKLSTVQRTLWRYVITCVFLKFTHLWSFLSQTQAKNRNEKRSLFRKRLLLQSSCFSYYCMNLHV